MKKVATFLLLLSISVPVLAAERPLWKGGAPALPRCLFQDNAESLRRLQNGIPMGNYRADVFIGGRHHASFAADNKTAYEGKSYPSNVSELVDKASYLTELAVIQAKRNAEVEIRLLVLEGKCRI